MHKHAILTVLLMFIALSGLDEPLVVHAQQSPKVTAATRSIEGVWAGHVTEAEGDYDATLRITAEGASFKATSAYFGSVRCRGQLTYVGVKSGVFEFREDFEHGSDCRSGRLDVRVDENGHLQCAWYPSRRSKTPDVTASLRSKEFIAQ